MTGFFDFFEFILSTYYINKIHKMSITLQTRFGVVLIVVFFFTKSMFTENSNV